MQRNRIIVIGIVLVVGLGAVLAAFIGYSMYFKANYYVVEINEYNDPPPARDDLELTDDSLADKNPVFKESLIDSRPVGDWELNASAAVIGLDCPKIKPGVDDELLELSPSYAEAIEKAKKLQKSLLPSANLLDGSTKQFDDGLYAALDLACYRGELGFASSAPEFIESLFLALPEKSPARPFLAGALELAEEPQKLSAEEEKEKAKYLADFAIDQIRSKPISFYTWSPELERVWKFYRYLQWDLDSQPKAISNALSAAILQNDNLISPYQSIYGFYARLTNPPLILQPLVDFDRLKKERASVAGDSARAVFPPSTSRETELFEQLFPDGIPPSTNLMSELIRAIRSGTVDLKPKKNDGWYQYQAYALESMLLPKKIQENEKLLLTAAYKRRLVEAFKALLTKRRETHARQLDTVKCAAAEPLREGQVTPRLRVEPCATFYLRTARAYAFLQNFLRAAVGEEKLTKLHGLSLRGNRQPTLAAELETMRQRFYGFYLIACEDLGMEPQLLPDEPVDQAAVKESTQNWLALLEVPDADLNCDTRVSIPIASDPSRDITRLWATLGVRLVPLAAKYAKPPKVRPKKNNDEKTDEPSSAIGEREEELQVDQSGWADPPAYSLDISRYVLAVDEFAEFELPGSAALTREEFRAICDKNNHNKEQILQALRSYR